MTDKKKTKRLHIGMAYTYVGDTGIDIPLSNGSYANKADVDLPNITPGHEVIIHWNYDGDSCWTIGNGSIDAFCGYIRENLMSLITPKEEK